MNPRCDICGKDLPDLPEIDVLIHIDHCLDRRLDPYLKRFARPSSDPVFEEMSASVPTIDDLSDMPTYNSMPVSRLKEELDRYGLKKSLDTKYARQILKEIWMYIHHDVFPSLLDKYRVH